MIFDQFEDVFRKDGLFKAFYKFLSDTTDLNGNLIIGFSWKTEILIPSENEAYHYWQQSKEQAEHFSIPEFGSKETNLLIAHLEGTIGKIDASLKRRLVESSQGYPWLLKKLCVHIYEQINSGKNPKDLVDENLNFEHLFNSDIELLTDEETKYLKYIAQRASDGNFFETSEVNDTIPEKIINTLRDDKRLIIRSGLNYNIYWDIFRDYLVNGHVPQIGESYIIRSSVFSCLDIFLLFSDKTELNLESIKTNLGKNVIMQTIENCLIDLRSIGLIKKNESNGTYQISSPNISVTEENFKGFITEKFKFNTVYQLAKEEKGIIDNDVVVQLLKRVFKGYSYQDKTWRTYANLFLNWIKFSNLEISSRVTIIGRGKGKKGGYFKTIESYRKTNSLRMSPKNIISEISNSNNISLLNTSTTLVRDLAILDLIEIKNDEVYAKETLRNVINDPEKVNALVASKAYNLPILKKVADYMKTKSKVKSANLITDCPDAFNKSLKESSKSIYATNLVKWGKFINDNL